MPSAFPAIVCDNGTGYIKCGFSRSNFPTAVFPSLVGRPSIKAAGRRPANVQASFEERGSIPELPDVVVGADAAKWQQFLNLSHPIENGVIRDWDSMTALWEHMFTDALQVDPKQHRVLLTEAPMNPRKNRERMVETMLETFEVSGANVSIQAVLTLYAQGLTTGVVVDSGDGVTHIVPIYDGYALPHQTRRLDLAGRDISRYLSKLLFHRGYAFNSPSDLESVRELKERFCFVSCDLPTDRRLAAETTVLEEEWTLPDGRTVRLGPERFEAPEVLFQPHLLDRETPGLSNALFDAIQSTDVDLRSELYKHIVLSGGTTMYPGLPTRLEQDIRALHTKHVLGGDASRAGRVKIRIDDPPKRKHMVFQGGAVLADLMLHNDAFWVTRQDWQEHGANALSKLEGKLL